MAAVIRRIRESRSSLERDPLLIGRNHWQDRAFSFPLQPPLRRSPVRSTERKITRKRRAQVRKSGVVAERKNLLPLVSARWMPDVSNGEVFARRAMPSSKSKVFRLVLSLTCLASPCRARRQPVKAASREAVAWHAPALRGWRWSGLLGFRLRSEFCIDRTSE
jgi:hypothetical protein